MGGAVYKSTKEGGGHSFARLWYMQLIDYHPYNCTSVGHSHKNTFRIIQNAFKEQSHCTCMLEKVEHCGGKPEQAATMATHGTD